MPTFANMEKGYHNLWVQMKITRTAQVEKAARKIISLKDRYLAVEQMVGTPWYMIGALHMREDSNNFAGVLHNGEHIIGTSRKTRLVPAGRGPFSTWEEAAVDALKLKGHDKINDWSIERVLFESEKFNGWGYLGKGNSPYLWAGSNLYTGGKYVRDHVYSRSAVDPQLGVAPVIKRILELEGKSILPTVSTRVAVQNVTKKLYRTAAGAGAVSLTFWEQIKQFASDHTGVIILGLLSIVALGWFIMEIIDNKSQKEYDEGRYQPSGETEGGAFWTTPDAE